MVGNWDINVVVSKLPQKVATAFANLGETIIGATYIPIAYIGSQIVNGTNHAVLAEQTIITGRDTKNIVLIIFNEKPEGVSLVNIERIVEGGLELGGTKIDVETEIPEVALSAFNEALGYFVGSTVEPFALLATKITKGTDYIFVATVKPVALEAKATVALVTVNTLEKRISFIDVIQPNLNKASLGYAFTW